MEFLLNPAFLCCIAAIVLIVVGVGLVRNDVGFWDFVETELLLLLYEVFLICSLLSAGKLLEEFLDGSGGEKLAAILFIPLCVAATVLGARYGGNLIYRGIDALINGTSLNLQEPFSMGHSVLGEYPQSRMIVGLAVSPTVWMLLSMFTIQYRWWIPAAIGAAILGALATLVWYVAAALLVYVFIVVAGAVVVFCLFHQLTNDD